MIERLLRTVVVLTVVAPSIVIAPAGHADDVGITNARLLELAPGRYSLEADVSAKQVGALRPPVVPERFTRIERPRYRSLGIGLVVSYEFSGSDGALAPDDVLLLPWGRSAVLLTARWLDGSVHRAMFSQGPVGIRVPIRVIRPVERSKLEVAAQHAARGLTRLTSSALPALLALALGLAFTGRHAIRLALAFTGGHALCLVLLDLRVPMLPPAMSAAAAGLGVAILARSVMRQDSARLGPLLFALGVVDGLGWANELSRGDEALGALVPAFFGAAVAMDVVLVGAVALLAGVGFWLAGPSGTVWRPGRAVPAAVVGSLAIAISIAYVVEGLTVVPGYGLEPSDGVAGARLNFSGAGAASVSAAPRRLDGPAMVFLNVEPLEVRVEVLLGLVDFLEPLRIEGGPGSVVPVDVQDAIAQRARRMVAGTLNVVIDGRAAVPLLERTDFVSVAATGVTTRVEPEAEPLDTAVLGVTFVFGVDRPPSEVSVEWQVFPAPTTVVPAVWTDPSGSERTELTSARPLMTWSSDLAAFAAPPVRAVPVHSPRWPLASLGLVALVGGFGRLPLRSRRAAAWLLLVAAVALYPFARQPVPVLGGVRWVPNRADTAIAVDDLLTNVYRSFGLRDEEAIYDQLAVSVAGEHLSSVYLENRRALELENRGGARARVDEVEILDVRSVRRAGNGGLRVEATWSVSGSVNHFGHVHYRQNRYEATIHLLAIEGLWKIGEIEVLDERRVL